MTGRASPRITVLLVLLVLGLFVLPWLAGRYPIYIVMQILILAVFSGVTRYVVGPAIALVQSVLISLSRLIV